MQEEVENRTLTLVVSGTKFTGRLLKAAMGIKEIRLLLKERLKSPQHCILVSSHNLTEIAAVTDILIFIRGGKIIKIVKNGYNEKELEALYEDIMTSGQREEA